MPVEDGITLALNPVSAGQRARESTKDAELRPDPGPAHPVNHMVRGLTCRSSGSPERLGLVDPAKECSWAEPWDRRYPPNPSSQPHA